MRRAAHLAVALPAALALAPPADLVAQPPAPLDSGARVRVTAVSLDPRVQIGRLVTMRGDSLVLRSLYEERTLALRLQELSRLEVSRGRRAHALAGAGIGSAVGLAIGVALGLASGNDEGGWFPYTAQEKAAVGGVSLGAAGAVIGAVLGAMYRTDRWERVSIAATAGAPPRWNGRALRSSVVGIIKEPTERCGVPCRSSSPVRRFSPP